MNLFISLAVSASSSLLMALLTLITPVLALVLGRQLNNETIGLVTYAGSGVILLGLLLYQYELIRIRCRD